MTCFTEELLTRRNKKRSNQKLKARVEINLLKVISREFPLSLKTGKRNHKSKSPRKSVHLPRRRKVAQAAVSTRAAHQPELFAFIAVTVLETIERRKERFPNQE